MAEDREADSPDESASSARPDGEEFTEDSEVVEEHVAPDDAREPTPEELEQLLESDEADAPKASLHDRGADHTAADDDTDPDDEADGDKELVSVGAATTGRKAGAGADDSTGTVAKGRSKKDKATPKQKKTVDKPKRTTPVGFVKEAVGELRKVVYPTAPQLGNYFLVVLVFVLVIIGFVSLLDLGFGALILKVFG